MQTDKDEIEEMVLRKEYKEKMNNYKMNYMLLLLGCLIKYLERIKNKYRYKAFKFGILKIVCCIFGKKYCFRFEISHGWGE